MQRLQIGNDVVDLTAPEAEDKEHDRRFLDRVYTGREQALIDAAPAPTTALWLCWAAKEAAYKALKKQNPSLIFAHKRFEVLDLPIGDLWTAGPSTPAAARGRLSHDGRSLAISFTLTAEWAHASVVIDPPRAAQILERVVDVRSDALRRIERSLASDELESVRFPASAHVRWLGHDLLDQAGFAGHADRAGVRIVRPSSDGVRSYPVVLGADGTPFPGVDISFSHHGSFVAAAVVLAS